MTPEELRKREDRATKETFVIARTEEGFRIHNPTNVGHVYYVTGTPKEPACTCPDFQNHQRDPAWRCKHILAVLARYGAENASESERPEPKRAAIREETPRMILKRSVSPDGKIDALSVEFSVPVSETSPEETRERALQVLAIQDRIALDFLRREGRQQSSTRPMSRPNSSDSTESATIVEVGGADGRWGRRLFLVFQVNGRRLRFYGRDKKLSEAIRHAGFPDEAESLEEGMRLDLPCRVVTQPTEDGKYLNVVRVLPAREERKTARW